MTNCRDAVDAGSAPNSRERAARSSRIIYRTIKRMCDIILSLAAIIVFALPMLVIAIVIRVDSPGPALFRQRRVGKDGRMFRICKFRTMYTSAPSETETNDLEHAYSYITRIGVFLRKTSLDELPQLFNVLSGDMSLIGPRPLIVGDGTIHSLRQRHNVYSVRPGITGWAQINGRDNLTNEQKVALDAEYIKNMSAVFDMKIIFRTISVVFSGEGFAEGKQTDDDNSARLSGDGSADADKNAA